jgi:hypothetical protein
MSCLTPKPYRRREGSGEVHLKVKLTGPRFTTRPIFNNSYRFSRQQAPVNESFLPAQGKAQGEMLEAVLLKWTTLSREEMQI